MSDNPRKDRFLELSKNNFRTPTEETERAALAQEFPETAADLESKETTSEAKGEETPVFPKGK